MNTCINQVESYCATQRTSKKGIVVRAVWQRMFQRICSIEIRYLLFISVVNFFLLVHIKKRGIQFFQGRISLIDDLHSMNVFENHFRQHF